MVDIIMHPLAVKHWRLMLRSSGEELADKHGRGRWDRPIWYTVLHTMLVFKTGFKHLFV